MVLVVGLEGGGGRGGRLFGFVVGWLPLICTSPQRLRIDLLIAPRPKTRPLVLRCCLVIHVSCFVGGGGLVVVMCW